MRKIEEEMVEAVNNGKYWKSGNTEVFSNGGVYLFGNRIAFVENGSLVRDEDTFRKWPTVTTKSRLSALNLPTK